jgi:hypothetical protein
MDQRVPCEKTAVHSRNEHFVLFFSLASPSKLLESERAKLSLLPGEHSSHEFMRLTLDCSVSLG